MRRCLHTHLMGAMVVCFLLSGCGGEQGDGSAAAGDAEPAGASSGFAYARVPILSEPPVGDAPDVQVFPAFASTSIEPRDVLVWLPPGYDSTDATRYPVVYFHDGFMGADRVMPALLERGAVRPAILVAVRPSPLRILELAPEDVMTDFFPPDTLAEARWQLEHGPGIPASEPLLGNAYLSFVTDELMPWVNERYRAATGPENTFTVGASMGGLMSVYAVVKRPDLFGAGAALSTHWPLMGDYMVDWMAAELPFEGPNRLYFDHGTDGADASYGAYQKDVDVLLRTIGVPFTSHVFEGHDHSVAAWRRRMHLPLQYLLGT